MHGRSDSTPFQVILFFFSEVISKIEVRNDLSKSLG